MVDDVLEAVWTLNHHAKNLKHIRDWIWVSECPEGRFDKYRAERKVVSWSETFNELDDVAREHYDVRLRASANICYDPSEEEPEADENDENGLPNIDMDACDMRASFVYPEVPELDQFMAKVTVDYDYIYELKSAFLWYILDHYAEEDAYAKVISRSTGKNQCKLVGIKVCTKEKDYKFHHRSDLLYEIHSEVPEEKNVGKPKVKIFKFEKDEICNAKKTVEEFLLSRKVRLFEKKGSV